MDLYLGICTRIFERCECLKRGIKVDMPYLQDHKTLYSIDYSKLMFDCITTDKGNWSVILDSGP